MALTVDNDEDLELVQGTLSAWIKPTWAAGANGYNPAILAMRDESGTRFSWHISDDYQAMSIFNGADTQSVPVSLVTGEWHHLAVVQEGDKWTGYVDGISVGTVAEAFGEATGLPLTIGSSTGSTEFFSGAIDELTIFERALSAAEVHALAQEVTGGVHSLDVGLKVFASEAEPDWQSATLGKPGTNLSSWSYSLPGTLENFYEIVIRGRDTLGNTGKTDTVWRGVIDMVAPRVSFTSLYTGEGLTAETHYYYTFTDMALDEDSLVYPCSDEDMVWTYNEDTGSLAQVSAACTLHGHKPVDVTVTACDMVGFCTTTTASMGGAGTLYLPLITK